MRLRPSLALAGIAFVVVVAAPARAAAAPPQGQETDREPAEEPAEEAAEPAKQDAEEPGVKVSDRLRIDVGPTGFEVRARGRGRRRILHNLLPVQDPNDIGIGRFETSHDLRFESATGAGVAAEATFKILPRVSAVADILASSAGDGLLVDNRRLGLQRAPGDRTLAEFQSDASPEYLEWGLGGTYRFLPGTKHALDSKVVLEGTIVYRESRTEYDFDAARLVSDPFAPIRLDPTDPANFADPNGARGALAASPSYTLDFEALTAGVRIGGNLSDRFAIEGELGVVVASRFSGSAELGPNGIIFKHTPQHEDPNLHVPNCKIVDPNSGRECGIIDADLFVAGVGLRQRAKRARGIGLDLAGELKINDWFALTAGYHRQDFRTVGGTDTYRFGPLAVPTDPQGNKVQLNPTGQRAGELIKTQVVTQAFHLRARFRFF
jgi:hypothetical protein